MVDFYHTLLKKLAHFQVEHPYLSLLILAGLTIMIYGGVSQVRTVASLEQMMPNDIEEIKAFNVLRDNLMGQDMIAIVLDIDRNSLDEDGIFDMREKEMYEYVTYIQRLIEKEPDILEVYSFADVVNYAAHREGTNVTDEVYHQIISDPHLKTDFHNYINRDYSTTLILATTDISANDPRMKLLSSQVKDLVDRSGHPPGVEVSYTGTPIIQQQLGEMISQDRKNTQWISTLLVFLITLLTFGTLTSAFIPIIIVTISVNWLYGTMGYTNLPISTLAGGVAAMVIGIGIDFAIHIMNKFKYERKKGYTIRHAVEQAIVDTGTALTATSITTIAAFLAFLTGQMPEMGRFGILMAIGIGYSLIFSLFGLPSLMILEEKLICWLRGRLHFGIEGEYHLEPNTTKKKDDTVCKV